jgi:hypothetical protein
MFEASTRRRQEAAAIFEGCTAGRMDVAEPNESPRPAELELTFQPDEWGSAKGAPQKVPPTYFTGQNRCHPPTLQEFADGVNCGRRRTSHGAKFESRTIHSG